MVKGWFNLSNGYGLFDSSGEPVIVFADYSELKISLVMDVTCDVLSLYLSGSAQDFYNACKISGDSGSDLLSSIYFQISEPSQVHRSRILLSVVCSLTFPSFSSFIQLFIFIKET